MAEVNGVAVAWAYELSYQCEDGSWGGYSAGEYETLNQCVVEAVRMVGYYVGLGYAVTLTDMAAYCMACKGAGGEWVARKRGSDKWRDCAVCKGEGRVLSDRRAVPVDLEVGRTEVVVSLRDLESGARIERVASGGGRREGGGVSGRRHLYGR